VSFINEYLFSFYPLPHHMMQNAWGIQSG